MSATGISIIPVNAFLVMALSPSTVFHSPLCTAIRLFAVKNTGIANKQKPMWGTSKNRIGMNASQEHTVNGK